MKDFNILSYVGRELWAITPDKMAEMIPALIRHAKGTKLTEDELLAFMGGRDENEPPTSSKRGNVAIVPIRGVIAHRMNALDASSGGTSCESIQAMLTQAFGDGSVGTIVLDVDSPGGTVTGCTELAQWAYTAKGKSDKRVIAVAHGLMASAGYWLPASFADEIVSIPSGDAGSIGVFSVHKDLSEALAKEGIKITVIKSAKFKAEGNPFEPLSEEAEARLQARVDAADGQFYKDIARGRGIAVSEARAKFGEGRLMSAKEAKDAGLIDRIATMDQVISGLVGRSSRTAGARAEEDTPPLVAEEPPAPEQPPAPPTDPDAAIRERLERI